MLENIKALDQVIVYFIYTVIQMCTGEIEVHMSVYVSVCLPVVIEPRCVAWYNNMMRLFCDVVLSL